MNTFIANTDSLMRQLLSFSEESFNKNQTYPPHNIYIKNIYPEGLTVREKIKKLLVFEFALAGFSKEDISIDIKEGNLLTVEGKYNKKEEYVEPIRKGIAFRTFKIKYAISNDFLSEPKAEFKDGMLKIVFEEKAEQKKLIKIN